MATVENLNAAENAAEQATQQKPPKKDSFLLEFLDMKGVTPGANKLGSIASGRSFASGTIRIPRIQTKDLQILPPDYKIYDKYKNMLRVGLEEGQIRHKMIQDGLDPDGLFNNPLPTSASVKKGKKRKGGKIGKSKRASKVLEQFAPNAAIYAKYIRLLEVGMQEGPVLQRLVYDGLDPEGFLVSEAYSKYLDKEADDIMKQKLDILKMTLPKIRARPNRADFTGVHSILGEFFKEKLEKQASEKKPKFSMPKKELMVLEPDNELYERYGKMFAHGLSEPQVFHKLIMDGFDPSAFMESNVYNSYIADEAQKLMDQKLDILKRFLPKMQLLQDQSRAASVSKADFAEVQAVLGSFIGEQLLKRQAGKKDSEFKYEAPPVELKMLPPHNALWDKYAKMVSIGLKEGAVLHKVVYDGLDPEGFLRSFAYNLVLKQQLERTKRAKLQILGIFLPKAQREVGRGDFEEEHVLLSQLFEHKKKSSTLKKAKAKASFKTMRPKKLRRLHADDPSFDNYTKMLQVGISEGQVIHKVVYDGVEPESYLDSNAYRAYLKQQQAKAREEKLALLREFLPKLDQGDEFEDEGDEEESQEPENAGDKEAKAAAKELQQKTLRDEMTALNDKVSSYFSSWWGK